MNNLAKNNFSSQYSVGILGVRGYVGQELVKLIDNHPLLSLAWVSSRQLEGQLTSEVFGCKDSVTIENLNPVQVAKKSSDIVILALPNGLASAFVTALQIQKNTQVVIDLSADYRFDKNWFYSLPEVNNFKQGKNISGQIKISNPGCYATAMQLAIAPIQDLLSQRPNCFGVSGYSGAGTTPNQNNDLELLTDNLLTYSPVEHLHEKEVSHHLELPVSFTPHVASFFRGINMTVQLEFNFPVTKDIIETRLHDYYQMHPLVSVVNEMPNIKQVINSYQALIGGLTISKNGKRGSLVCCIDNLLKGAASQAIQNINLAIGQNSSLGLLPMDEINPLTSPNDLGVQLQQQEN